MLWSMSQKAWLRCSLQREAGAQLNDLSTEPDERCIFRFVSLADYTNATSSSDLFLLQVDLL